MVSIDKILGLAGVGSTIANLALLKRFMSGVAVVIALTAISSTMAGMLLVAGFYAMYLGLMHHGLDPTIAALTVSGIALIIIIALVVTAMIRWNQLRDMPHLMQSEVPIVARVTQVADAFINGLMEGRTPPL